MAAVAAAAAASAGAVDASTLRLLGSGASSSWTPPSSLSWRGSLFTCKIHGGPRQLTRQQDRHTARIVCRHLSRQCTSEMSHSIESRRLVRFTSLRTWVGSATLLNLWHSIRTVATHGPSATAGGWVRWQVGHAWVALTADAVDSSNTATAATTVAAPWGGTLTG